MYKTIYNNPEERSLVTYSWAYWDNAFSDEELCKIEDVCSLEKTENATVIGELDEKELKKIRKSQIKFYNRNENTDWIFEKFNSVIMQINERFYNYNLNGYESFQYTEYHSTEKGKYDWHMDIVHGATKYNQTRKLSCVLCISEPNKDFFGGEFQINTGNEKKPEDVLLKKGRIIFFPSYIIHRVKPVTQGIRKSIVIWVTGPKFI